MGSHHYVMIKTQIQLEEWQYEAVKKACAREARSLSDFIRESVALALRRGGTALPLSELAGKYEPTASGPLKPHDQAWAESIR